MVENKIIPNLSSEYSSLWKTYFPITDQEFLSIVKNINLQYVNSVLVDPIQTRIQTQIHVDTILIFWQDIHLYISPLR